MARNLWDNRNGPESACNTRRGLTRSTGLIREGLPDMVPNFCSFEGCTKKSRRATAGTLCEGHTGQKRRGLQLRPLRIKYTNLSELIEAHADRSGECWEWTKGKDRNGYGKQRWGGFYWLAHRLSYTNYYGPIPDGRLIDHRCHNHGCVNPAHLRLATQKQNQENLSGTAANSGYRGVFKEVRGPNWRASVKHNGVNHVRSGFSTPEEAAEVARELRLELFTHNELDRVNA